MVKVRAKRLSHIGYWITRAALTVSPGIIGYNHWLQSSWLYITSTELVKLKAESVYSLSSMQKFCFFFFGFFFFFWLLSFQGHTRSVWRLGVKSELQLPAYTAATAVPDTQPTEQGQGSKLHPHGCQSDSSTTEPQWELWKRCILTSFQVMP